VVNDVSTYGLPHNIVMEFKDEIWKDVIGYENLYQVSSKGRLKAIFYLRGKTDRILNPCVNSRGYLIVRLAKNKKGTTHSIHILVAQSFLGHEPCGHLVVVDHINNDRTDNRVENLQLISNRENASKERSGKIGAVYHKGRNNWRGQIHYKGRTLHLGCFKSEDEAHIAYKNALLKVNEGVDISILYPKKTVKGSVWQDKRCGSWVARYKTKNLGSFKTKELAIIELNKFRELLKT